MNNTLQRAVIGLVIAVSVGLVWYAMSRPSVRMDDFVTRLDDRRAELNSMLSHLQGDDQAREDRVALSIAVGARLRAFENVESERGTRLSVALGRKFGIRYEDFEDVDRDLILAHPEIWAAMKLLYETDPPASRGRRVGTEVGFDLRRLGDYLALMTSLAVDRGDEAAAVVGFERAMQVVADCYERRDPEIALEGDGLFRTVISSAGMVYRLDKGFISPELEDAFMAPSMGRLLSAVPSDDGRARLTRAIDRTLAWIPTPKDAAIFRFLESVYYHQRDVESEYYGAAMIPARVLNGLEELIDWQNEELKTSEEPGFQLTVELVAASDRSYSRLSRSARIGDGSPWTRAKGFAETVELGERAKAWIAAGKVD